MPWSLEAGFQLAGKKGINTRFNLLSHLPNTGQEVKLEIGSQTKHQWIDTTSCFLNIKALCSSVEPQCFCRFKHRTTYTHTYIHRSSLHIIRGRCVSADCIYDPINDFFFHCFCEGGFNSMCVSSSHSSGLPCEDNHSFCVRCFSPLRTPTGKRRLQ